MKSQSKYIIISGIDGSGKTTIIEAVRSELARQGIKNRYVWLRYNHYLTRFLLAFCRFAKLTRYEYFENSRVGYHDFYKSKLVSWLFVFLTFIDTLAVSIIKVYIPAIFSQKTVICDRWVIDILIDLEIDTKLKFPEGSFVSRLFKSLVPKRSFSFIIKRDIDTVRKTRDESVNDRNFPKRFSLYERHSGEQGNLNIDNNGPLESTIQHLTEQISK